MSECDTVYFSILEGTFASANIFLMREALIYYLCAHGLDHLQYGIFLVAVVLGQYM